MRKSLRTRVLALFTLAVLIPAATVSLITISLSYSYLWKSVKREQKEIARRAGDTIRFRIDSTKNLIIGLSNRNFSALSLTQTGNIFRDVMKLDDSIMEIVLTDRRTARDVSGLKRDKGGWSRAMAASRKGKEEYTKAVSQGVFISRVNFSGSRVPYLFISAAGKKHIILAKVDMRGVWDTVSKISIGVAGYVFIVDSSGMLIAHPATERVIAHADFMNLGVVRDFLSDTAEPQGIYRDEAGDKVISFCYPIKELGWGVFTSLPYGEVIAPVNRMVTRVALLSLVLCSVFLFAGVKFAGGLMDPLIKLKVAAERLSQGKYDIEVRISSGDELEALAATFNDMVKSLKALEELRDDLVSMIVHDMKSPLSAIAGSLDYLISLGKDVNEQKEVLDITRKSAENLNGLVQNLLDISKMEDGRMTLKREEKSVQELAGDIVSQFRLSAETESKTFEFTAAPGVPSLNVDVSLIRRVISNLLTNSLHHTTSGGKIWMTVTFDDKGTGDTPAGLTGVPTVRFEIGDDGVGIPEEYRTKIFEKFVQVERRRAHLRTGTGLGLTFCKMAVELHGGKIWVESEEGKGSRFFFEIPV
jgi:signal transduction histidine kinase